MPSRRFLLTLIAGLCGSTICGGLATALSNKGVSRTRKRGTAMKIYLAGPLGFSEAGRFYQDGVLIPRIEHLGYEIINPWKLTQQQKINAVQAMPYGPQRRSAWQSLNREIGGNNSSGIDRSDLIVAVLDGPDVDSGTASEIGYGFAKGKAIIGYRGDFRLAADNEGSLVNLQVEYFIRQSGGDILANLDDLLETLTKIKAARGQ
jgi:nucleoside 2-deoxyribosyltransferase